MAQRHSWSKRSLDNLATVDPELSYLCNLVLKVCPFDLVVTCGRRSKEDQEKAVKEGRSKVHWPHGNHNVENPKDLARAVDIHPYPIDFKDARRYYILGGLMRALAYTTGTEIRWGGDWDGDGVLTDQTFNDLPHFELRRRY